MTNDSPAHPARVVVTAAPAHMQRARVEAARLGLPFHPSIEEAGIEEASIGKASIEEVHGADLVLMLDDAGWCLLDPSPGAPGPVRADLVGGAFGRRLRAGIGRDERLAKAMGLRAHPRPRVLDATAGLGRDSIVAAALGCSVVACERSSVVALLLRDALDRATAAGLDTLVARIDLRVADARDVMAGLDEEDRPDIVILDPMFPEREKSALVKKEMQILHRLLGPEPDLQDLLALALRTARRRVVVKRPAHAPTVGARPPGIVVPGRTARYDVYLVGRSHRADAPVRAPGDRAE